MIFKTEVYFLVTVWRV